MRLRSLNHLVDATAALSQSERILVFGSASLLASFPELGETGGVLEMTYDADLLPDPINSEVAGIILESLGENSLFHEAQGYHADILDPAIIESLPLGWEQRLVRLSEKAFCLDPLDLAAMKVVVGREKDLSLVRVLVALGKIGESDLRTRIGSLNLGEKELFQMSRNFFAIFGVQP